MLGTIAKPLVAAALTLLIAANAPAQARDEGSAARKPNIVLIVADDLGFAGLGCQGGDLPTPRIDSLAKDGVRCTNAYVSCPVCSPTRAGLLTGRYQQRFGHEFNPGSEASASPDFGLPMTEVTLADRVKKLGYATGIVGKWHLGYAPRFHPLRRGFDSFFGFKGGAHNFRESQDAEWGSILRGTEPVPLEGYLTDAFTREAVAFIERHQGDPFFLYLTYNAVHASLQATEKDLSRFVHIKDEKRWTHAAMLSALDDGVGVVLDALRRHGVEEETLVIFISDNGGPTPVTTSRNDPLSGFKGQVREAGIRVPLLLRWKGHLPAGKVYAQPVISLDIAPTCVAAAGGMLPEDARIDGVSLLPYLSGREEGPPHWRLFWRFGNQMAIRQGDWKLSRVGSDPPQLFNLVDDVAERKDLSSQEPQKVKELDAAWKEWDSQLEKPHWQVGRARR